MCETQVDHHENCHSFLSLMWTDFILFRRNVYYKLGYNFIYLKKK